MSYPQQRRVPRARHLLLLGAVLPVVLVPALPASAAVEVPRLPVPSVLPAGPAGDLPAVLPSPPGVGPDGAQGVGLPGAPARPALTAACATPPPARPPGAGPCPVPTAAASPSRPRPSAAVAPTGAPATRPPSSGPVAPAPASAGAPADARATPVAPPVGDVAVAQDWPRALDVRDVPEATVGVVGQTLRRPTLPLALLTAVVLFLLAQHRLDRRDPKLAAAPLEAEADLEFQPFRPGGA